MAKCMEIAKKIGRGTAMVLKALGEGVAAGCEASRKLEHPEEELGLKMEVTLGPEDLKALEPMTSWQLEKIFRNKTVKLKDDPAVYRELGKFASWQLEAIFGKEE